MSNLNMSSFSHAMKEFIPDFRDQQVSSALKKLTVFSLLIIVVPLGSMFTFKKFIFEAIFGYSSQDSILYGAVVAVIMVHIILGAFVYAAWKEEGIARPEEKED